MFRFPKREVNAFPVRNGTNDPLNCGKLAIDKILFFAYNWFVPVRINPVSP